jgi:hypothetical protein
MSAVQRLDTGEIEQEILSRWDITGHQVNRHLLCKALTGTDDVVLDHLTFPPGFVHHMHRPPHAHTVVIPVSGVVQLLGSLDDIGYEAYPEQVEATPSLGCRQRSSSCA